jgi:CHAD domain-containing protein
MTAPAPVTLGVPPSFRFPDLATPPEPFTSSIGAPFTEQTLYFDTPDLRLARFGVTVRHVDGERWTVTLPDDDGQRVHVVSARGAEVPASVADLVRALRGPGTPALRAVARLRTMRRTVTVLDTDERALGVVRDDEVSVLEGRRIVGRFRLLQVTGIDEDAQRRLVERLQAHGAGDPDPTPAHVRVLGRRALAAQDLGVDGGPWPRGTAGDVVRRALAAATLRLLRHDPLVRLGDDPEAVHQMRVALRRVRSDLRTFASLVDPAARSVLQDRIRPVAAALGAVRDRDVLLERLEPRVAALPDEADRLAGERLLAALVAEQQQALADVHTVIRSPAYDELLQALFDAPAAVIGPGAGEPASVVLAPLVARSWRRLRRLARPTRRGDPAPSAAALAAAVEAVADTADPAVGLTLDDPVTVALDAAELEEVDLAGVDPVAPDGARADAADAVDGADAAAEHELEAADSDDRAEIPADPDALTGDTVLHEIRIRAKRVRYAAEAAAPVIGNRAKRFAGAATALQTVLGEHQDAVTAAAWLRQRAVTGDDVETAWIAGLLAAEERAAAAAARAEWTAMWDALDRRRLRSWLG